jgi:hypothetical protein
VYDIYDLFILLYYRGPKMPKNVAIYFFYTRYVYDYSPALCADMITVKKKSKRTAGAIGLLHALYIWS